MPHIEVLPNSTSNTAPGWAYVPDTGFDPSKAAIQPSGSRKRVTRDSGIGRGDTTTRQAVALQRRLAELEKDNHKDVQIPIPKRDAAGRASKGKMTPNVRRILTSQKTFMNYLDDERALSTVQIQSTPSSLNRTNSTKVAKPTATRHQAAATPTPKKEPSAKDPALKSVPQADSSSQPIVTEQDNDPLLRSIVPRAPSERVMQALLSEPPLLWDAARARASNSNKPPRHFCDICGYWGKVRCTRCNARTCGLDCYKTHQEERCVKF